MYLFLQSNIVNLVSFVFMEVLEINEKYWNFGYNKWDDNSNKTP